MNQVTANGWTTVKLSPGPTNPHRLPLDHIGVWRFHFKANHPAARVRLNEVQTAGLAQSHRPGVEHWGILRATEPNSYLTLEVRDQPRRVIQASLTIYPVAAES